MKKIIAVIVALATSFSVLASPTSTLKVPSELQGKTIELVLPFNPGGETDSTYRFMADQLKIKTGLNFVILNKGGGGGIIAARHVIESPANGLTLLGGENSTFVVNPAINFPNAPDPKLLSPISVFASTPIFFYTKKNGKINSVDDLIWTAKNDPKFSIGTTANLHVLVLTDFFNRFGVNPYFVNFKTPVEMAVALDQSNIDLFITGPASGIPFVDAGKIQAIGVAWDKPFAVFPAATPLTTVYPGFRAQVFFVVSAPAGTPKHLLDFYNRAFRDVANSPVVRDRFSRLSTVTWNLSIEESTRFLNREYNHARQIYELVLKNNKHK